LVKRLEQKGFVLVGKDKKDRRCTQVSCTQKATEKYEAMSTYRKQLDALMVEHMSKTEAAELARLLEILLANLQGIDR
jgi:DNA-binding MarR family transcriptional regulator